MAARKLIAHGPSSLTLALPHKWVKKYNLHKGDTVNVQEDDQGLRISITPFETKRNITINLSNHDFPATGVILTTLYRRGYDEIYVRFKTSEEYQNISTVVRSLLGAAIIENKKNTCVIRTLQSNLEQDFSTLFKRVFWMLLQQLEDLGEALGSPETLKTFYRRDADLNSIINLSLRMINKGYVTDHYEELHLYYALLILEECGDDITKFTIEVHKTKSQKLKEGISHCVTLLRMLYDAYFQKKSTIADFYKKYYLYWPDAKKSPAPIYDYFADTQMNAFYLRSIVEKIIHLAETLLIPPVEQ